MHAYLYPLLDQPPAVSRYVTGIYTLGSQTGGTYTNIPSLDFGLSYVLHGSLKGFASGPTLVSPDGLLYYRPMAAPTTVCVSANYSEITFLFNSSLLHRLTGQSLHAGIHSAVQSVAWQGFSWLCRQYQRGECLQQVVAFMEACLDKHLTGRRADARTAHAQKEIHTARGMITVDQLGANLRVSTRTLYTLFTQQVGLTPKAYIQLTRLRACLEYLHDHATERGILNECCFRFGYYDHAHFNKEFKQVIGICPQDFIKSNYSNQLINNNLYYIKVND